MEDVVIDVSLLEGATSGNICDAQGKSGAMDTAVKPVYSSARLVGPAYPVCSSGPDNLAWHLAIETAPAGSVLVVSTGGYTRAGFFGSVMSAACRARGILGLVTDGACRDCDDLEAMDFPVFAAGLSPCGTQKADFGEIGAPVECGGVGVRAGDIIVGDRDGVVVVPAERWAEVLSAARAIVAREVGVRERLLAGETTMDIYGLPRPCGER